MAHTETILKRPDGSKVKLIASVHAKHFSVVQWDITVMICAKGKRSWYEIPDTISYQYRTTPIAERSAYIRQKQLEVVTADEILAAKIKLWETIKPTL